MREFTVGKIDDGKKLVRVLTRNFPNLAAGTIFKALRRKDIQVNGQRLRHDIPVYQGDVIRLYFSVQTSPDTANSGKKAYDILFQDKHYLVLDKQPDIMVQPGRDQDGISKEASLIEIIRRDLADPDIHLCHRLDRQTSGLLVLARGQEALKRMQHCMKQGMVVKRYQCLVLGIPDQGTPVKSIDGTEFMELSSWLEKDAARKTVYLHNRRRPGDKNVITLYRILDISIDAGPSGEPVSHLEVELRTGRTHQIRAHLASIGHPLLGDGKYGQNSINRHFQGSSGYLKRQQLSATSLNFQCSYEELLSNIAGRTIAARPVFDWRPGSR